MSTDIEPATGAAIEPTRAQWAERITLRWQQSVEGIIDVGRLLIQAKDELPHGEFGKMIKTDLPFGERAAQMLRKIAQHRVLSDPNHGSHLPASWRTLYRLSELDPPLLEAAIEDGTITAKTTRIDADLYQRRRPSDRRSGHRKGSSTDKRQEVNGALAHVTLSAAGRSVEFDATATLDYGRKSVTVLLFSDEDLEEIVARQSADSLLDSEPTTAEKEPASRPKDKKKARRVHGKASGS